MVKSKGKPAKGRQMGHKGGKAVSRKASSKGGKRKPSDYNASGYHSKKYT